MTAKIGTQPIPLYGMAINDAIASGDGAKMRAVRDAAHDHLATAGEVMRLLPALETAIQSTGNGGGVIRPLYAVTIQDALARGDAAEIARLKAEVASYSTTLASGSAANMPIVPYGVAIQDAKTRGDSAEVQRLTALAQSLMGQLNATK